MPDAPKKPSQVEGKEYSSAELEKEFQNEETLLNYELTDSEKIWGAISYLSFLCIIPLLAKRNSVFCQFHARQGLVLAILFTIIKFLWIIRALIPFLGIIELIIVIIAAVKAYSGNWWKIPGIYDLSKKLAL